jgi:putative endonuclease
VPVPDPRHERGRRGEEAAARWLATHGWDVLARRWRIPGGELDLVCIDPGGVLVGVEVKLRSSSRAGSGLESVDAHRVRRLRRALVAYRTTHRPVTAGMRIDLIALEAEGDAWRLRHLRGVDLG